jgi:hypothetical protein
LFGSFDDGQFDNLALDIQLRCLSGIDVDHGVRSDLWGKMPAMTRLIVKSRIVTLTIRGGG